MPDDPETIPEIARSMAEPIDFDDLEAQGLLEKKNGPWYRVASINDLPKHVREAVVEQDLGPGGLLVRFVSERRRAALRKRLDRE